MSGADFVDEFSELQIEELFSEIVMSGEEPELGHLGLGGRKLPKFSGNEGESVEVWILDFEDVMLGAGKKEDVWGQFVGSALGGAAQAARRGMPKAEQYNWGKVKEMLKDRFSENPFNVYDRFIQRVLRTGERVQSFLEDLKVLATAVGWDVEAGEVLAVKRAFVTGMPPKVRAQLIAIPDLDSKTLREIERVAENLLGDLRVFSVESESASTKFFVARGGRVGGIEGSRGGRGGNLH